MRSTVSPYSMVGVIDCNNFFVSCERVFSPQLAGVPVVVLSNNDGCVVSRSNEAKAMGIKMGAPFFKLHHLKEEGKLFVRSGNLTLYTDMSRRVMSMVRKRVPRVEVYSIDECFMDLNGIGDVAGFGRRLSAEVERWTGIPVSVGVAETKTLAKLASKFAKQYPGYHGCCVIDSEEKIQKALQLTEVGDVWGVGRRVGEMMRSMGVRTAYDFAQWEEERVRRIFTLPTLHVWYELHGHSCYHLETPTAKQSITSSRSFKTPVTDFEKLRALVADFSAHCARSLRREGSAARAVTVYIRTDRFRVDLPQYANCATVHLDVATSDVREIASAATQGLAKIFRPYFAYKKAGVTLTEISQDSVQGSLFDKVDRQKQERLLSAIDRIQQRMGEDALRVATQESVSEMMNHEFRSPNYTTELSQIIEVN